MCYGNILESAVRRARVEHLCTFCHRTIKAGEAYETFVFDGSDVADGIVRQKQCVACATRLRVAEGDKGCIYDLRGMAEETAKSLGFSAMRKKLREAKERILAELKSRRSKRGGAS